MAEVARWGTPAFRITWVGVSYLMSAVALSHGLRQLMCARKGMCFASRVLPIIIFFPNVWGRVILRKIISEMRICRTKFGITAYI